MLLPRLALCLLSRLGGSLRCLRSSRRSALERPRQPRGGAADRRPHQAERPPQALPASSGRRASVPVLSPTRDEVLAHRRRILGGEPCDGAPDPERGVNSMNEHDPDIERLTSEELLSIVLSMVAPAESDPMHEYCLRFDAQRAATELYCRAACARRGGRSDALAEAIWTTSQPRGEGPSAFAEDLGSDGTTTPPRSAPRDRVR